MTVQRHHIKHLIRTLAIAALVIFFSVVPFLHGRYFDGVLTLAIMAQLYGLASIVFVPVGLISLWYRCYTNRHSGALALYFMFAPGIAFIAQLSLATSFTERSRNTAIENSVELIDDIEAYRNKHGHYPVSLFGVWPDYSPGIVGISHYVYEPNGDAYNLAFEQPRFFWDDIGSREFVMYNPRDEHAMTSHAAWRLIQSELRGWYAVHDAGAPHWKRFLFD